MTMMLDQKRTSAVIASELAKVRSRHDALKKEVEELQRRLREAMEEMGSLTPAWRPEYGRIATLESELDKAKRLEAHAEGRSVRLVRSGEVEVRSFVKKTEKRIYLSNGLHDNFFGIDGKHPYLGKIHPDDLRLILAGDVGKLPLVKELAE